MRNHPQAVMMFAAGFGTRMKTLTQDRPKPMIPVAGRPLIDHALTLAEEIAPARIVANLHYKPETLERHLAARGVTCLLEIPEILETGGGLRNALSVLGDGPVFTMNTDAIWQGPNPLQLLAHAWEPERMDALLIGIPPEQALGHKSEGDFTLGSDGCLSRGPGLIFGGVQIIKTELLAGIPEKIFSLNLLWDRMLAREALHGLRYPGQWCDVGHPEGIALAESLLERSDV
ncbi:nucleotidyltransferase family protein [Sulfitobacter aestuarii]|uniref:Nucleotidyltransferase family protein n=1 Tax=Sulfitobacter aestuarii TaxID=2161676 RepID=A0ABW5U7J4_9RHOB